MSVKIWPGLNSSHGLPPDKLIQIAAALFKKIWPNFRAEGSLLGSFYKCSRPQSILSQQYIVSPQTATSRIIPLSFCLLFYNILFHNRIIFPMKWTLPGSTDSMPFLNIYSPLHWAWCKIHSRYSILFSSLIKEIWFPSSYWGQHCYWI